MHHSGVKVWILRIKTHRSRCCGPFRWCGRRCPICWGPALPHLRLPPPGTPAPIPLHSPPSAGCHASTLPHCHCQACTHPLPPTHPLPRVHLPQLPLPRMHPTTSTHPTTVTRPPTPSAVARHAIPPFPTHFLPRVVDTQLFHPIHFLDENGAALGFPNTNGGCASPFHFLICFASVGRSRRYRPIPMLQINGTLCLPSHCTATRQHAVVPRAQRSKESSPESRR